MLRRGAGFEWRQLLEEGYHGPALELATRRATLLLWRFGLAVQMATRSKSVAPSDTTGLVGGVAPAAGGSRQ